MGSNYLTNPLVFLIDTLFGLYILAIMLRFLLQTTRADFYNPISQFLVKITNPPLRPLRRIIPGIAGIDLASVVLMVAPFSVGRVMPVILPPDEATGRSWHPDRPERPHSPSFSRLCQLSTTVSGLVSGSSVFATTRKRCRSAETSNPRMPPEIRNRASGGEKAGRSPPVTRETMIVPSKVA